MAKLLKDETAKRLIPALDAVEAMAQPRNRATRRRVRTSGGAGGASRSWVVITSVTDAANYIGTEQKGPSDSTVVKSGITIKVYGATANEFTEGFKAFADKVKENGADVYYIDGAILG
jgi:hypothetical protein